MIIQFISANGQYLCPVADKMTKAEIINDHKDQKINYSRILDSNNSYKESVWFVDKKDPGNIIFYHKFKLLVGNAKDTRVCNENLILAIKFILYQDRRIQDVVLLKDDIEVQYIPKYIWEFAKEKLEIFFIF